MDVSTDYMLINMETWPRREHFRYYQEQVPCTYSVTATVDVTDLLAFSKKSGYRLTALLLYAVSRTVNEMDCMKMMLTESGEPGIWKVVNPVFTIFHEDDKTFSDLWMEYHSDMESFCQEYESVTERYGRNKGIKARDGQPANFFCFSDVPWLNFTGYSTSTTGEAGPHLFPIITCGQYHEDRDRLVLSVALNIAHAAADGYNAAVFYRNLQKNIDEISGGGAGHTAGNRAETVEDRNDPYGSDPDFSDLELLDQFLRNASEGGGNGFSPDEATAAMIAYQNDDGTDQEQDEEEAVSDDGIHLPDPAEMKREYARKMLQDGYDVSNTAYFLDMSEEDVSRVQDELSSDD